MKVVNLVRRDRRSLEHRKSSVSEDSLMRLARGPILACHVTIVGGGCSPGEAIAFVIRAHAVEAAASPQLSFEVIDARKFDIRHRSLIVITVLIEPRNRIRAHASI